MIEIIPSINELAFEAVKARIKKVEPYVSWCHLDVTDGIFSKHETWRNPSELPLLETKLNVEVHLMIAEPEKSIDRWLTKPVKRAIVHIEAVSDPELIIQKCRDADVEVGFAVNPETPWEKLQTWFGKVDMVQTLNVHPGSSGQNAFWQETLQKIEHIRKSCPSCIIEVDGGVNPETAKKAVATGVNLLVAGAYIFGAKDIKKAIEGLKKQIYVSSQ